MIEATDGPVVGVDGTPDLGEGRQHRSDRGAAGLAEEHQQFGRRLIGYGHMQPELVELDRNDEVLTCQGIGNEVQCVHLGRGLTEVRDLHAVELRSSINEISLVDESHAQECTPEIRRFVVQRCREGLVELGLGDETALEQQRLEGQAGLGVEGGPGGMCPIAI